MSKPGYFWLSKGNRPISSSNDHSLKIERRANKRRTKLDEAGFWDALGGGERTNERDDERRQVHNGSDGRRTEHGHEEVLRVPKDNGRAADVKDLVGVTNAKEKNDQRRASLLTMLHASEERHKRATLRRPSVLAKGIDVQVKLGDSAGQSAPILDADYINNRVLLLLPDQPTPQWLPFSHVKAKTNPET